MVKSTDIKGFAALVGIADSGIRVLPAGMDSLGGIASKLIRNPSPEEHVSELQFRVNLRRECREQVYRLNDIGEALISIGKGEYQGQIFAYLSQHGHLIQGPKTGQIYATDSSTMRAARALDINRTESKS